MNAVWEIKDEPEGRAKARGMSRASSAHYRDLQIAREAALRVCLRERRAVSSDDVRAEAPELFEDPPEGYPRKKANWAGSVFTDGNWVSVGWTKSTIPGAHRNDLRTWMPK